jgi:Fe-S oxidoreductase
MTEAAEKRPLVGLFVTCLVDLFRPSVGFAAINLLKDAGARVEAGEPNLLRAMGLQFGRPCPTPIRGPTSSPI